MTEPQIIVHETKEQLSTAVSGALAQRIVAAQQARGIAHIVLTGGSMGGATLTGLRDEQYQTIDWSTVHVWWGDERFVPSASADRNETEARDALLDHIDIPAANVHVMPPSDDAYGADLDAAAVAYAAELADFADPQGRSEGTDAGNGVLAPAFDVLMLGVGPDAHIASLFPHHPAQRIIDATVIPVRDSPKPPPLRLSLTFTAINAAREVWLLVAGTEKAAAVAHAAAESGTDRWDFPASGAHGTTATIWWLDEAAAAGISRS